MDTFQGRSSDSFNHPAHVGAAQPMRRSGLILALTGLLVMILFGVFILSGLALGLNAATPVWIGVAFGAIMFGYGLFRWFHGPSALDHPYGGTNA